MSPILHISRGLSPYIRGNLLRLRFRRWLPRSIPVHTGKPSRFSSRHCRIRVYPRTYGETMRDKRSIASISGLSPYIRGNLKGHKIFYFYVRSIPVHTGKPVGGTLSRMHGKVYPRTYGATGCHYTLHHKPEGLSPYIRGNRHLGLP